MKIIDVMGKPCPIPVIETRKALAKHDVSRVVVKADNTAAVQNLEKMANGLGFGFSYTENAKDSYEVTITKDDRSAQAAPPQNAGSNAPEAARADAASGGLVVVIGGNTMGVGAEELGKILIKGFIYSLTELPAPPRFVIFLNSGAYLTSDGAGVTDDLKKLEEKGSQILTCGTCSNYYDLQDKLAVGSITDMYGITEKMTNAAKVINI